MASPFSIFRRYQATLLAVFGVALMVAFVILPAVIQMQQMGGGGGGYSSDAVLAWTGGEVTKTDLGNFQKRRYQAARFVSNLRNAAAARPGGKDMPLRELGMLQRLRNDGAGAAIESMLLAQKGRDMGMSVDEAAVMNFLRSVTDNTFVNDQELRTEMAAAVHKGSTLPALYETLKEELLAYHVQQMALKGISPQGDTVTTPSEAWEYYNRMNRRVSAEFVPIAVEDFVSEVKEPSSREIQAFYDEHKSEYSVPGDPEPGFKVPRRAEFHYIVADYNAYLQEEKAKVTREEVEAYYETNKDSFRIEEDEFPVDEIDWDDPRQAVPSPPVVEEDQASGEEDSTEAEVPGDGAPESNGDGAPESNGDGALELSDFEAGASELPVESGGGDEAQPATETPADDLGEATLPELSIGDDTATPSEEPATDGNVATDSADDSATGSTSSDDLEVLEKEPKYKPLEDVEDDIRRSLAAPRAEKRLNDAIDRVREVVEKHFEKGILNENPEELDPAPLADEPALKSKSTGLLDIFSLYEAREEFEIVESSHFDGQRNQSFQQLAYLEGLPNYQAIETQTGGREKVFLAWKVAEEKPMIPELQDIKDKVTEVWKLQAARDSAKNAAEALVAKVDGDKPLKEQLGSDHEVIAPAAFSYYDPISVLMMRFQGQPPRPAAIEGIEDAGRVAVKKAVVQMPVGEVRVVPDAAKEIYYVVRLANDESTPDSEREQFMQSIVDGPGEGPPPEVRYVGQGDRFQLSLQWYRQLQEEYEVKQLDPEYFQRGG